MTKVRVAAFSLSLDGFGAGPEQSIIDDPLGKRGMELHRWFFGTKTFRAMHGEGGGSEGVLRGARWRVRCLHSLLQSGEWPEAGGATTQDAPGDVSRRASAEPACRTRKASYACCPKVSSSASDRTIVSSERRP
jgi:hypothetical protein